MVLPCLLHCAALLPPLPSNAHPKDSWELHFPRYQGTKGVGGFRLTLAKQSNSHWKPWLAGVRITGLSFWPFPRKYVLLCMSHVYLICHKAGGLLTQAFLLLVFFFGSNSSHTPVFCKAKKLKKIFAKQENWSFLLTMYVLKNLVSEQAWELQNVKSALLVIKGSTYTLSKDNTEI